MQILYEDNHLIAINKPFCMPSQGDSSQDESVVDWVSHYLKVTYNKPGKVYVGLLHRIDRPAGGLMLLAKTSKAAARMSRQFQERTLQKEYLAITERAPEPPSGELTHYLRKIGGKNIMRAFSKEVAHSKRAHLAYSLLKVQQGKALLEIRPSTGRRHQIRVQLASIGCVLVGDVKYGKTEFNEDKSICLFSHKLSFEHPTQKKTILIEAPFPQTGKWQRFATA